MQLISLSDIRDKSQLRMSGNYVTLAVY